MNGTHDCLPRASKLLEEADDGVSRLRVQAGSRLVEEEKQRGLSSELNTNGETLALFNAER